jgi:hypothetical protein
MLFLLTRSGVVGKQIWGVTPRLIAAERLVAAAQASDPLRLGVILKD